MQIRDVVTGACADKLGFVSCWPDFALRKKVVALCPSRNDQPQAAQGGRSTHVDQDYQKQKSGLAQMGDKQAPKPVCDMCRY